MEVEDLKDLVLRPVAVPSHWTSLGHCQDCPALTWGSTKMSPSKEEFLWDLWFVMWEAKFSSLWNFLICFAFERNGLCRGLLFSTAMSGKLNGFIRRRRDEKSTKSHRWSKKLLRQGLFKAVLAVISVSGSIRNQEVEKTVCTESHQTQWQKDFDQQLNNSNNCYCQELVSSLLDKPNNLNNLQASNPKKHSTSWHQKNNQQITEKCLARSSHHLPIIRNGLSAPPQNGSWDPTGTCESAPVWSWPFTIRLPGEQVLVWELDIFTKPLTAVIISVRRWK